MKLFPGNPIGNFKLHLGQDWERILKYIKSAEEIRKVDPNFSINKWNAYAISIGQGKK